MISYENWFIAPYDENIYSILHFLLPEYGIFSPANHACGNLYCFKRPIISMPYADYQPKTYTDSVITGEYSVLGTNYLPAIT